MLKALDTHMPQSVTYTRPEGGLFLWCTLPPQISLSAFVEQASAHDVFVVPGTAFNCDENAPSQSFRLNYSTPTNDEIEKGIAILADLCK